MGDLYLIIESALVESAADGWHEMDLTGLADLFQQTHSSDLAIHRHRQIGPDAPFLDEFVFDAWKRLLQLVDDLAKIRRFAVQQLNPTGHGLEHGRYEYRYHVWLLPLVSRQRSAIRIYRESWERLALVLAPQRLEHFAGGYG